jgi:hypothetical protein
LNHAERNRAISNRSPMRTDRVLGMRDWDNARATDETDGWFDRGDAIGIARTDNAAVCFATKRYGGKIRGSGGGRSSARAARIAIDSVGIVCLSTAAGQFKVVPDGVVSEDSRFAARQERVEVNEGSKDADPIVCDNCLTFSNRYRRVDRKKRTISA